MIASTLPIAHPELELTIFVREGTQALLHRTVKSAIPCVTITPPSIVIAQAVPIALLCAVHAVPRKVHVGLGCRTVFLGTIDSKIGPIANACPDIIVRLIVFPAPALIVADSTMDQRAILHLARFAIPQVVTSTAPCVGVARAMTIAFVTPNRHSPFVYLVTSVFTVGHPPRKICGTRF
jgi:hypothetical protein